MPVPASQEASSLHVVLGLGRSGCGAARLLRRRGHAVLVLESNTGSALEQKAEALRREGIEVQLGAALKPSTFTALPDAVERLIVSPGIRWDHPTLEALRLQGMRTDGEISTAWEATAAVPWIGITGTNGKTTVTNLVHHLLNHAGLDAPMCGNVGHSAAELALARLEGPQPQWLVVELSSYQIEAAPQLAPRIGVWTTLTPDHLERHGTLDRYRAIKRGLLERAHTRILNADDADLRSRATSWQHAHWVTTHSKPEAQAAGIEPYLWIEADQVMRDQGALFPANALAMPGRHNRQNMLMAAAVALEVGLQPSSIADALRQFPGVPHRLEQLGRHADVPWFNDSKATNYDAAEVALQALDGPLVVLAGGEAKQGDAQGWLTALQEKAAAVVLFGAARHHFRSLLAEAGYAGSVETVEGLDQAVPLASRLAQRLGCRGVLLSPACASFDQYRDFEARGDHFRTLVHSL